VTILRPCDELPCSKFVLNFSHLFFQQGDYCLFFPMYCIQHCFICRPSHSTLSEDAGIEPRTVSTSALAVRPSNHSARSNPHVRQDLIHNSARSHPQIRLDLIHIRLDLISHLCSHSFLSYHSPSSHLFHQGLG
jgi:hypothetical protein